MFVYFRYSLFCLTREWLILSGHFNFASCCFQIDFNLCSTLITYLFIEIVNLLRYKSIPSFDYVLNAKCKLFKHKVVLFSTLIRLRWERDRAFASHVGDRGSIPGPDSRKSLKQVVTAPLPKRSATGVSVKGPRR